MITRPETLKVGTKLIVTAIDPSDAWFEYSKFICGKRLVVGADGNIHFVNRKTASKMIVGGGEFDNNIGFVFFSVDYKVL